MLLSAVLELPPAMPGGTTFGHLLSVDATRLGGWTQIKVKTIEGYIGAFTTAAQRARQMLYLNWLDGNAPQDRCVVLTP